MAKWNKEWAHGVTEKEFVDVHKGLHLGTEDELKDVYKSLHGGSKIVKPVEKKEEGK